LMDKLPAFARWRDEGTIYRVKEGFVESLSGGSTVKGVEEWSRLWGRSEQSEKAARAGEIPYKSNPSRRPNPQSASPEDYRLLDGAAGADVDLVGPGPAYEKWKQTPDYGEWRKRTEEILGAR
jgi:hypothetical protein